MRGRGNTNRNKLASGPRLEDHRPRRPNWRNDGSDPANGTADAVEQTFAWGPDLSSTEQGAGGIGGLAVMLDDSFELGGGSGAVGHMFPVYDGNGNIVKVYSTEIQQDLMTNVAEYRYGPFGEQRGQSGSMATRLPFRWSTKFTDNETALVYYGYRYYSGSLGRWVSRDPIGEADNVNLYSLVSNRPNQRIDRLGLHNYIISSRDMPETRVIDLTLWNISNPWTDWVYVSYIRSLATTTILGGYAAGVAGQMSNPMNFSLASDMLSHYVGNTGTPFTIDFARLNNEDKYANWHLLEQVNDAVDASEDIYYQEEVEIRTSSLAWNQVYANRYLAAIQNYSTWAKAKVVEGGCSGRYRMQFAIQLRDVYDFDPNQDVAGGVLSSRQAYHLFLYGVAKPYLVNGTHTFWVEWDKGERLDKTVFRRVPSGSLVTINKTGSSR